MVDGSTSYGDGQQTGLGPVRFEIDPEWIDYNGHLNMARYPIMFDRAIDQLIDAVGLSSEPGDGPTLFAAEAQFRYLRAVMVNDRPEVTTRVLRIDKKRLHSWQEMRVGESLVATCENLHLCVMRREKHAAVTDFPSDVHAELIRRVQTSGEWPAAVGQPIAARMAS